MLEVDPASTQRVGYPTGPEASLTLTLETSPPARSGSEFTALSRRVRAAGLLERRYGSYAVRLAATGALYTGTWLAFALIGSSWLQLITAGVLGVAFTQVAFLGHDSGHRQVLASRRGNDLLTIFAGNLFVGLSYGWWADKHNRHHAKPNHEGHDPDIGEGVLAFTQAQVAGRTGRISRFVARNQAVLFFPLLTLEGLNLHVASLRYLLAGVGRRARYQRLEAALFAVHGLGYLAALAVVLTPAQAIAFFAVHQAVFGLYMGSAFAPNHKGMPVVPRDVSLDFLRRQVLTSRNVRGGWFTDQLLGGLNYQVEHHLFPNMPRGNLRRAQAIVRQYCAERAIQYTETSLFGSYAMALRHLHALGAPLRARAIGAIPVTLGDG